MAPDDDVRRATLATIAACGLARLVPPAARSHDALAWLAGLESLDGHDRHDGAGTPRAGTSAATAASAAVAAIAAIVKSPAPADAPLVALGRRLGLSAGELTACALAREVEFDPLWAHAIAALQSDGGLRSGPLRPTLGLVARCLAALGLAGPATGHPGARLLAGPAVASGLLQAIGDDTQPASERLLALHPQLLPWLTADMTADMTPDPTADMPSAVAAGGAATPPREARFADWRVALVEAPRRALPASWQTELALHAAAVAVDPPPSQLVLRAGLADEAAVVAAALGAALGRRVARVHAPSAHDGEATPPPGLEAWLLAVDALPLVVLDAAPGERVPRPAWRWRHGTQLVALGADGDVEPADEGATRHWRLALPPPAERAALWREALGDALGEERGQPRGGPFGGLDADTAAALDVAALDLAALDVAALGRRHACGPAAVHAAAVAAASRARAAGVPLSEEHVRQAVCEDLVATTHGLSALAQWVPVQGTAAGFVADAALRGPLDLALGRCRWREQCGDALGPAVKARHATGVRLLFIGASGTGKTLAAAWLAERLGKPLYRVDLAAVTSKYIGETEKNLSQLLSRAEHLDCVLLFDEADAVFGARTEVRQANDRFANTQTNYLLQRIEGFGGIAVLTSNSKARFDDAFMRRLDHVIEFPLPRGAARAALWRAHLGEAHALSDAELARLAAEVDLPGGHIRNVVLGATLAAALEAGRVEGVRPGWAHLVQAAAQEFAKLGRRLPDSLAAPAA